MSSVLLVQGTALQLPLKGASVACCVTSPPYYGLRDYGTGTWQGGDPSCTHSRRTSTKEASITTESRPTNTNHEQEGWRGGTCGRCGATRVDQQLGLEDSPEAYIAAMVQVFREVKRVLHPMGTCWIVLGDSYNAAGRNGHGTRIGYKQGTNRASATGQDACMPTSATLGEKQLLGMPWRLALAMQADGWILRSEIIWHKLNPMPESVQDRPTRTHEQVFLFSKQARYYYDGEAVRESFADSRQGCPGGGARFYAPNDRKDGNDSRMLLWNRDGAKTCRACRSVWSLASEPSGFQHYAAFPQALVRRCLLAGAPSRVCTACGAPWRRVVEPTGRLIQQHWKPGSQEAVYAAEGHNKRLSANSVLDTGYLREKTTTGFTPTCTCAAGTKPCTVLDPFAGSGTVGLVARELGHHAVLCDLSWPYLHDIARERLSLAALAAWQHGQAAPAVSYADLPLFGG